MDRTQSLNASLAMARTELHQVDQEMRQYLANGGSLADTEMNELFQRGRGIMAEIDALNKELGSTKPAAMERTERGFSYHTFTDRNGVECSLQKSSIATEDAIWLGATEIGLKRFEPFIGWSDVKLPDGGPGGVTYIANNRMHLTREQVAELLPLLQLFVQTGEIDLGKGRYVEHIDGNLNNNDPANLRIVTSLVNKR